MLFFRRKELLWQGRSNYLKKTVIRFSVSTAELLSKMSKLPDQELKFMLKVRDENVALSLNIMIKLALSIDGKQSLI